MGYEAQCSGKQYIAKKEHAKNKFSKKLLKQERKLLVHLNHPCVVQQLTVFDSTRSPVLLMERMWMSLSEYITNKQSYHTKLSILHDTACGLQYIHEKGITHCDLTADNILLTEKITAKLADFGRAGFCEDAIKYLPEFSDHLPPEVHKAYPKTSYSPKWTCFHLAVSLFTCLLKNNLHLTLTNVLKLLKLESIGNILKLREDQSALKNSITVIL